MKSSFVYRSGRVGRHNTGLRTNQYAYLQTVNNGVVREKAIGYTSLDNVKLIIGSSGRDREGRIVYAVKEMLRDRNGRLTHRKYFIRRGGLVRRLQWLRRDANLDLYTYPHIYQAVLGQNYFSAYE